MKTSTELRAELAEAERAEREASEIQRKEQAAKWKELLSHKDSWEWEIKPTSYNVDWFSKIAIDGLQISCRVKPAIVKKWLADGNEVPDSRYSYSETMWHGMFYYRTEENILTYGGGGTHVLSTPKLCTDEQWAELVAGRVPSKFQSKWAGGTV